VTREAGCHVAVHSVLRCVPAQVQSVRQELQGLKHLGHRNLARYMDLTYDVDQDNITVQVGGAGGVVWACQRYDGSTALPQLCMEYVAGANLNKLLLEGEQPFYGEVSALHYDIAQPC